MKNFSKSLLIIWVLFILRFPLAHSLSPKGHESKRPTLLWIIPDIHPTYIKDGPNQGQGLGDEIFDFLKNKLVGFHHEDTRAHLKRAQNLSHKYDMCVPVGFYNEQRAKSDFYYSNPVMSLAPPLLITNKKDDEKIKKYLVDSNTIDLVRASNELELYFGVAGGRFYSHFISQVVENFKKRHYSFERMAQDKMTLSLFKMFEAKRMDIILLLQEEWNYVNPKNTLYVPYKILNAPRANVHIMCSKTKNGLLIINLINKDFLDSIKQIARKNKYYGQNN